MGSQATPQVRFDCKEGVLCKLMVVTMNDPCTSPHVIGVHTLAPKPEGGRRRSRSAIRGHVRRSTYQGRKGRGSINQAAGMLPLTTHARCAEQRRWGHRCVYIPRSTHYHGPSSPSIRRQPGQNETAEAVRTQITTSNLFCRPRKADKERAASALASSQRRRRHKKHEGRTIWHGPGRR